jgi:hypothetical protein
VADAGETPAGDVPGTVSLTRLVDLTTMADHFALGWQAAVIAELDMMRAQLPYADTLELTLRCERRTLL